VTTSALADGRLVLEPLRIDHAAEMVDVLSDAGLYAFTGGSLPSRGDLDRRYARARSAGRPSWRGPWALEQPASR
jgi:hypothetical protein